MGKKKYVFQPSTELPRRETIARSDLVNIIERALAASSMDVKDADIANRIRTLARQVSNVDFNTFQCRDSCGCPLTQAGAVLVSSDGKQPYEYDLPSELTKFFNTFDREMSIRLLSGI